jgi:hypothetical protein
MKFTVSIVRELSVWLGQLKQESQEVKEDMSLRNPDHTTAESLEAFDKYCKEKVIELGLRNVLAELDTWYFGEDKGELTHQERANLFIEVQRVGIFLKGELEYKSELSEVMQAVLEEDGLLFESGGYKLHRTELERIEAEKQMEEMKKELAIISEYESGNVERISDLESKIDALNRLGREEEKDV